MIKSFRCKETEKIWQRVESRKLPHDIQRSAMRKLRVIHDAIELNQIGLLPGNRLEALKGNRFGQYSIRINNQWRICFRWHDSHAYEVEIVDYH